MATCETNGHLRGYGDVCVFCKTPMPLNYEGKWDLWYASLPEDLKRRLSLHDFKRLGDCFKAAFGVER